MSTHGYGYAGHPVDIPWRSRSEYPHEIHIWISHGCTQYPHVDMDMKYIYWMSHGSPTRNIHTKSTDRYPVDVPSGYPYEIHRTISHGQGQPCCPLAEKLLTITVISLIGCYPASMTIN